MTISTTFRAPAMAFGRAVLLTAGPLLLAGTAPAQAQAPARTASAQVAVQPPAEYAQIDVERARTALQALGSPDAATRQRAIAQVQEAPQRYAPPVLYALSHVLLQQGQSEQAMFWFYAGQLRGRYDANRCADASARQAIGVLNERYGGPINQYAFRHLPQLEKTVQEVIAWDRRTPHDYDHRWINLHGMDAFGASSDRGEAKALSLPEAQWAAIAEQTRTDYFKGFQAAMARMGRPAGAP